jgi:O-antigen ligase
VQKVLLTAFGILALSQYLPEFINSYALMLLLVATLGYVWRHGGLQQPTAAWWYAVLAYGLWVIAGGLYAPANERYGQLFGGQVVLMVLPALLLVPKRLPENFHTKVWWAFYGAALLASLYVTGIGVYRTFAEGRMYAYFASHYLYYTELAERLMHPAYFSALMAVALMGGGFLREEGGFKSRWYWLAQGWLLLFLLLLSARMVLIALLISGVLLALYLGWQRGSKKLVWGALIGAPLFALAVFWILPERLQSRFTELTRFEYDIHAPEERLFNGLTIRLAEWEGVFTALEGHWWLGHGTGAGQVALREAYQKIGFQVGFERDFNAHNQYLETWLHNGFIGLLLLLAVFVTAFRTAWRQKNWLALWFVVFLMLCILSESMLMRHRGILLLAVYLPLMLRKEQKTQFGP